MACFFSLTAGHIWTGGMSGTYFAIMCVFLMNGNNGINNKNQIDLNENKEQL